MKDENPALESPRSDPGALRRLVLFQCFLALITLLAGKPHTMLHEMDWPLPKGEQVAAFDFVGAVEGSPPSVWAVLLETAAFSFLGIMARLMYQLTQTAMAGVCEFSYLRATSRLLGYSAAGIAMPVALVALLWSSEITLLDVHFTLRDAGVGSIIAVSFVLGYFHDDTLKVLRRTKERWFSQKKPEDSERPDAT